MRNVLLFTMIDNGFLDIALYPAANEVISRLPSIVLEMAQSIPTSHLSLSSHQNTSPTELEMTS